MIKEKPEQNHYTSYEKIYSSALKLLYQLAPDKTYQTIVREAKKLVSGKHGVISLVENGELNKVYASSPILLNLRSRKHGYTYNVYKNQKPYIFPIENLTSLHPELALLSVGSDMSIPLTYSNKTFGVLSVLSHKNVVFKDEDQEILRLFSPIASLALRNMQLYSEVKKSLHTRDLFISMAAHELKTPLTTITIYTELLLKQSAKDKPPIKQMKIKLLSEIQRLTNLVNELLQINQIRTNDLHYHFKQCSLVEVLNHTILSFRKIYPLRSIQFKKLVKRKKCYIKGDFEKLLQAVTNLLTNAVKFSPLDKPIIIELSSTPTDYIISVTDAGPGIKKQDLPKIFDQFYKGSENSREGLGIGLFLVKNIIERHNGTISVTSQLHKGTTFSLKLPFLTND